MKYAFPNRTRFWDPLQLLDLKLRVEFETINIDDLNQRSTDRHQAVGKILSVQFDESVDGLIFETTITLSGIGTVKSIDYLYGQERWSVDIVDCEGTLDNGRDVRVTVYWP